MDGLDRAHAFVRGLCREVLDRGGRLALFAGRNPRHEQRIDVPIVFDWTVGEELARWLAINADKPVVGQHIVVSAPRSLTHRMDDETRQMYLALTRDARVRAVNLDDDEHVGGHIRAALLAHSDAIVTVGGGKGVHNIWRDRGTAPVLPMDLVIGASIGDGEGSPKLYRTALVQPEQFFSETAALLPGRLAAVSLQRASDPVAVAVETVDILEPELTALAVRRSRERLVLKPMEERMPTLLIDPTELDRVRIKPWSSLSDREFLLESDQLREPEIAGIRQRLEWYGICQVRIRGAGADELLRQSLARAFGPVVAEQNDYAGEEKPIHPQRGVAPTTGDSAGEIGPHVDGTQDAVQPAFVVFHYIHLQDYAGESTFWDLAQVVLELDPEKRGVLLRAMAHPHAGLFEKKGLRYHGPMVTLTQQGHLALRERFDAVIEVHDSVRDAHAYLGDRLKTRALEFIPGRGDMVIFDNTRVLHGRRELGGDAPREHYRMWGHSLHPELRSEIHLGIRPIDLQTRAAIERMHSAEPERR